MRFLGIYREQMFSPGRVDDDAAIMDTTLGVLMNWGHEVQATKAEDFDGHVPHVDCVLTMGQSDRLLSILDALRRRRVRVVNPIDSIRLCNRTHLIRHLARAGLPLPLGKIVPLNGSERRISLQSPKHYWIKRGDVHKVESGDVVKVTSQEELEFALLYFRTRHINEIVVQEHVEGEVIKFYGVSGGSAPWGAYFSAFPESRDTEIIDDLIHLRSVAWRAAAAVGLEVYGGDAVITRTGRVVLIDLNAWPSFSRCRNEAAYNIAGYTAGMEQGFQLGISQPS